MDQYVDNRHKDILRNLLDNPANTGEAYLSTLQHLANHHPQSGLLQVLLARAAGNRDLKRAAAYFNTKALYKLVHHPEGLTMVDAGKIIQFKAGKQAADAFGVPAQEDKTALSDDTREDEVKIISGPEPETEGISNEPETVIVPRFPQPQHLENEPETEKDGTGSDSISKEPETVIVPREVKNDDMVEPGPTDTAPQLNIYMNGSGRPHDDKEETSVENTFAIAEEPVPETEEIFADFSDLKEKEYFRQDIEDEIYDEIVGIEEIGFDRPVNSHSNASYGENAAPVQPEPVWPDTEEQQYTEEEDLPEDASSSQIAATPVNHAEEKLILGNIVSADYLSFDKKMDELRNGTEKSVQAETNMAQTPVEEQVNDKQDISRYNDDKMPYSFMWWLDKTRKEHADTFQPYTANPVVAQAGGPVTEPGKDTTVQFVKPVIRKAPDELQQQYYENIFSLTSVSGIESDENAKKVEFDHTKKEDIIIERFIAAEPQIKPPAPDKLDNENKAKKSSEDQDALVTETLARIYTDQMLYHKAIATYKKLILKFPEKKLYFAAQIEFLEKKTN